MNALVTCIGWAFVIFMGLCIAWAFIRYVLPWILMLGVISLATYVSFQVYEAHQGQVTTMRTEAERAIHSLVPRLEGLPERMKKARAKVEKVAKAEPSSVSFCTQHPNAMLCEHETPEERD